MDILCPHCKQKTHSENNPFRPFCSERCKLIDLGTWAEEGYSIPVPPDSIEEEDLDSDKEA